jgi:hypothetical protein
MARLGIPPEWTPRQLNSLLLSNHNSHKEVYSLARCTPITNERVSPYDDDAIVAIKNKILGPSFFLSSHHHHHVHSKN